MYKQDSPKQVIIIRKDLNMRKGKMIAQGAHASMKVIADMMQQSGVWFSGDHKDFIKENKLTIVVDSPLDKWLNGIFKKIVVGAENLNDMITAYNEAKKQGIPCSLIEDAGLTEFGGQVTITAAAIGPDSPEKIDKITGNFVLL
jgi:PTH2 family peptidyl-tRNA hydrolase